MKKLLTLLVLLAAIGWLGFKGAAWWLTDQRLAELRQFWSADGALGWGPVSSSVSGDISVRDLRFESFHLSSPLLVERARFRAGSLPALFPLLTEGALPSTWALNLDHAAMQLDAALFRNWVTAGDERPAPLFAPVCGPDARQHLGSGDFLRMGIDRVAGDAMLNQTAQGLTLEVHTWATGSVTLHWPGGRLVIGEDGPGLRSASGDLELTVRDAGLMRRVSAYCARETGQSVDDWAGQVMEAFAAGLRNRGWQPAPQTLALYRQWLTEGGELMLTLQPDEPGWGVPVYPDEVASGAQGSGGGDESVRKEGLQVIYNGALVPDVYLFAVEPVVPAVPEQAREPVVASEVMPAVVTGWQLISLDNAERWLGHRVRVTLSNERVVEGRLAGLTDDQVEVARLVNGGEVAYPMARRAVERLEIWRQGRP